MLQDETIILNPDDPKLSEEQVRKIIRETVRNTLTQLGIDYTKPIEMQKDFQYMRELRETSDFVKKKGILILVAIFVTAITSAIALGLKEYFSS